MPTTEKPRQIVDGTHYHQETPTAIVDVLERVRNSGQRIRLHYGDTETGRDWGDVHDVTGRIGRSMGPVKVPILLYNARSMGGGAILDHCIVRIRPAGNDRGAGADLYRHPNYTPAD